MWGMWGIKRVRAGGRKDEQVCGRASVLLQPHLVAPIWRVLEFRDLRVFRKPCSPKTHLQHLAGEVDGDGAGATPHA